MSIKVCCNPFEVQNQCGKFFSSVTPVNILRFVEKGVNNLNVGDVVCKKCIAKAYNKKLYFLPPKNCLQDSFISTDSNNSSQNSQKVKIK